MASYSDTSRPNWNRGLARSVSLHPTAYWIYMSYVVKKDASFVAEYLFWYRGAVVALRAMQMLLQSGSTQKYLERVKLKAQIVFQEEVSLR